MILPVSGLIQIQSVVESNIKNMDRDSLAGLIADILNKQTGSPPHQRKVRECFILFPNFSPWSIPIFNSRIHVSKYRKYGQNAV